MEITTRGFLILSATFFSLSGYSSFAIPAVLGAVFFSLLSPIALAAPGSENFEGPHAGRTFNVHHWGGTRHIVKKVRFPYFDALLNNQSAQNIQFAIQDASAHKNISAVAQIRRDPMNPGNHVVWLRGTHNPADGKVRNELHYSTPYKDKNQPNGTRYTFAFRFYTPVQLRKLVMMQGYAIFPWLRIHTHDGMLFLNLARCKDGITSGTSKAACGGTGWRNWQFTNASIGRYNIRRWNTMVMHVVHSNKPSGGRIDVYLNGKKTTWLGRTTFRQNTTEIPWLKAGPYGLAELYYDDVYWQPGFIQPFGSAGRSVSLTSSPAP